LLFACWSPKGGSGTTVVAAALGLLLARAAPPGALLADLAGDLPTALGLTVAPTGIGLADWLAAPGDDFAAQYRRADGAPQTSAIPGSLWLLRMQAGTFDQGRRLGVHEREVRISARFERALARIQSVQVGRSLG